MAKNCVHLKRWEHYDPAKEIPPIKKKPVVQDTSHQEVVRSLKEQMDLALTKARRFSLPLAS